MSWYWKSRLTVFHPISTNLLKSPKFLWVNPWNSLKLSVQHSLVVFYTRAITMWLFCVGRRQERGFYFIPKLWQFRTDLHITGRTDSGPYASFQSIGLETKLGDTLLVALGLLELPSCCCTNEFRENRIACCRSLTVYVVTSTAGARARSRAGVRVRTYEKAIVWWDGHSLWWE